MKTTRTAVTREELEAEANRLLQEDPDCHGLRMILRVHRLRDPGDRCNWSPGGIVATDVPPHVVQRIVRELQAKFDIKEPL